MDDDSRFEQLSDRQRTYLRLVFDLCTSAEIAYRTGSSTATIDKQLNRACKKLGVASRVDAARRFHEYEERVQSLDPGGKINSPSQSDGSAFSWPLPSKVRPFKMLTRQQILVWMAIVAIVTPAGITVGAMVIVTIALLLGAYP
ncbi:helix-turn-helix transcriptional regulator [Sphingobium soli]|jgi:DNA-binding CsgD family transcriptional regulator|uniref:Helix-turn-helix transcriptional regulator n=1 Tax=Sphingobium soli TaxID=1591116 RepID=A0ABS8H5B3_9SPHN|nr:helix-turn-helix transcriptional regulator [Sphingobium soli]MCC4233360.1 helix-turn-helix transcriptional regulator [Sphingobium soli]